MCHARHSLLAIARTRAPTRPTCPLPQRVDGSNGCRGARDPRHGGGAPLVDGDCVGGPPGLPVGRGQGMLARQACRVAPDIGPARSRPAVRCQWVIAAAGSTSADLAVMALETERVPAYARHPFVSPATRSQSCSCVKYRHGARSTGRCRPPLDRALATEPGQSARRAVAGSEPSAALAEFDTAMAETTPNIALGLSRSLVPGGCMHYHVYTA